MKRYLLTLLTLGLCAAGAVAAHVGPFSPDAAPLRYALKSRHAQHWSEPQVSAPASRIAPAHSYNSDNMYFLDAPDGSMWFATVDYDKETVALPGGYATEDHILGYTFTIYDSKFEKIGEIKDRIELQEGESKVAAVMPGTTLTRKFFNRDDRYEMMVSVVFNKSDLTQMPYTNSRTFVYSIGADRDQDGDDVSIMDIPGYPVAAANAAADAWSEDFFISFFTESAGNVDDYDDYMAYLETYKSHVTTYTRATYSGGPTVFDNYELANIYLPGDGMEAPFFMSCVKDGKLTFITSRYEKCFFTDPTGMSGDESITPDNHLLVSVRQKQSAWSSELSEVASLNMPTTPSTTEGVLYTFYSVGTLMYDGDIDFGHYTSDGSAAFVVTQSDYSISEDDNYTNSYHVYDSQGQKLMTIAADTFGYYLMSDLKGYEPQAMFIYQEGQDYTFDFVDLYSGTTICTIPAQLGGEYVTTSLDRVPTPGGYSYASSLRYPETTPDGTYYHKIGWINLNGEMERVDRINVGKNVALAQVYITSDALNPYVIDTDTANEYLFLVKRYTDSASGSSATQEEFLIGSPVSDTPLLTVLPDAEKGALASVMFIPGANPGLGIVFGKDARYTTDFYSFPLSRFNGGEGTEANPYRIATIGDLQQIKSDPAAYYVLDNDIEAASFDFEPIEGFSGKLDGNGKSINNLRITAKGIFATTDEGSQVRNLTFNDPVVDLSAGSGRSGLIASMSRGLKLSNVNVFGLKATATEDFDYEFGSLVGLAALHTEIKECYIGGAEINMPQAPAGGLVGTIFTGSSVRSSAFSGAINAGSEVGGIVGSLCNDGVIADCHVNASITAANTVGGIAGYSTRGTVRNNHVQGTITAKGASRWSGFNAGGVVGTLTPNPDPANQTKVVAGNLVNLDAIATEGALTGTENYTGQFDTVHRIVGSTCANAEPEIIGEDDDYNPIYSDERAIEAGLENNYVISGLEPVAAAIAAEGTTTEGATKSKWDLDEEFLGSLGFKFGEDAENPWNVNTVSSPSLYFETSMILLTKEIAARVDEPFNIVMRLINPTALTADDVLSDFTMEYSEDMLEMTGEMNLENNILSIGMKPLKEGQAAFSVTVLGSTAAGTVAIATSGTGDIAVGTAGIAFTGSAVVAEGCAIEIYSVAGMKVAAGADAVDTTGLAEGIYIARAISDAGETATLKIAVR